MLSEMVKNVSGSGGGSTQYAKGNVTVSPAPSGTVVNCGFKPKKIFATTSTLYSGTYYAGMYIYDEDNGINGFVYRIANSSSDYSENFIAGDEKITVSDTGFTIVPINNTAWSNTKAYYYATD